VADLRPPAAPRTEQVDEGDAGEDQIRLEHLDVEAEPDQRPRQ